MPPMQRYGGRRFSQVHPFPGRGANVQNMAIAGALEGPEPQGAELPTPGGPQSPAPPPSQPPREVPSLAPAPMPPTSGLPTSPNPTPPYRTPPGPIPPGGPQGGAGRPPIGTPTGGSPLGLGQMAATGDGAQRRPPTGYEPPPGTPDAGGIGGPPTPTEAVPRNGNPNPPPGPPPVAGPAPGDNQTQPVGPPVPGPSATPPPAAGSFPQQPPQAGTVGQTTGAPEQLGRSMKHVFLAIARRYPNDRNQLKNIVNDPDFKLWFPNAKLVDDDEIDFGGQLSDFESGVPVGLVDVARGGDDMWQWIDQNFNQGAAAGGGAPPPGGGGAPPPANAGPGPTITDFSDPNFVRTLLQYLMQQLALDRSLEG